MYRDASIRCYDTSTIMFKTTNSIKALAYGLTTLVIILPLLKWGSGQDWEFESLNAISIFPLLGLWAFGLMWTHFVMSIPKRKASDEAKQAISSWYRSTSNAVLVLILLHPALLLIGIKSIKAFDYVAPEDNLYIFLAYFALAAFLMWEVVEYFKKKPFVSKYKPLWGAINNAAFIAIFIHAVFLGQHLQSGDWFTWYFYFLGITALFSMGYNYYYELTSTQQTKKSDT